MKKTLRTTVVPRAALVLVLVASLLPLTNFMGGSPVLAHAEDAGEQGAAASTSAPSASATKPAGSATIEDRQEVIYGLLDASGAARAGYVVNHLLVRGGGTLSDEGDYRSVRNLTSTAALTLDGRQISGLVDAGDFYYEGGLGTVQLPWLISVAYTLDGKTVEPAELAGSSGRLSVHIKTEPNAAVNSVFFENYLLQVQLTLEGDKARDVSAPDATVASAGANQQVAFTVLPDRTGDLRLEAQVSDFEMPGIQISALPFSMVFDVPSADEMITDMETLADAIGQLNDGVQQLSDGVRSMESGASALASGSNDLNEGLALLSRNSASLTTASSQVDGALKLIVEQLEGGAVDPAQIEQLIGGLRQLAAGLYSGDAAQPGLAEGLAQMQGGIGSATVGLDSTIAGLAPTSDQAALGALVGELGALSAGSQLTVQSLLNTNTQAFYVQGAWYGPSGNDGVKAGLEGVSAGLGQAVGSCQYMAGQLNAIAGGLEAGLGGLAGLGPLTAALQELSSGYSDFDAGLAAYANGVDTLARNYESFNSGLARLLSGVSELSVGAAGLYDGTSELYANVEDLPETVQREMDSFLEDYQKGDFTLVSFVSENNEQLSRVQFVLVSDPIEVEGASEETSDAVVSEDSQPTFWDRLLALFS
jgi:X-X-X-Leu-X-X-Gly heptad repeat protein